MTNGVIYFNTGIKCLVRLAVSLHSLREHYDGPVSIISSGEESHAACREMLGLQNPLGVDLIEAEFSDIPSGKNSVFLQKASVNQFTPYELTVFLDSDTLVRGDFSELWTLAEKHEFVVPQFSNWRSNGRGIKRRIMAWQDVYPELMEAARNFGPAVNSGVFAFRRDTTFAAEWSKRILPGREHFIPDETGLQVVLHQYPHRVVDQKFNVSCKYSDPYDPDTRVIHYHGRKHCRIDDEGACLYGADLWLSAYEETVEADCLVISERFLHSDRMLRHNLLKHQSKPQQIQQNASRAITLVTAVNRPYLEKLKLTLPTWERKPQLASCPLIIFYHDLSEEDLAFVHHYRDRVRLIPWNMQEYDGARELMLSAFVLGVPEHVDTPYWAKIDADAFFLDSQDVFLDHMFDYDLAGHRWKYTKPGQWIASLDDWAHQNGIAGNAYLSEEKRAEAVESRRFSHRRIASWLCLHKTDFTVEAAQHADRRLPVPSHDTYLWYLAERLPGRKWCWHNFKRMGAGNETKIHKLLERLPQEALS